MLSMRKRIISAAIEDVAGTPETVAAPTFFGYDGDIVNNVEFTGRSAAGTLSQLPAQPGIESGQHTFTTELYQEAPWAALLMPAVGFVLNNGAWRPSDLPANFKTITTVQNIAGKRKSIAAAMGTAQFNLIAGQVPTVEWTFTGRYLAESDAAQFTPPAVAEQHKGLKLGAATAELASSTIGFANATLTINNTISLILDVNAPGGIARAWIESREIQLVIDPLETLVATRNDDAIQRGKTLQGFSLAFQDMLIAAPKLQLRQIANNERNGLSARQLNFVATLEDPAGQDELTINFDTSD